MAAGTDRCGELQTHPGVVLDAQGAPRPRAPDPFSTARTTGTFALRSPVRPNPIASSVVELVSVEGTTLHVRGLDCLDGTPLLDLKPDRGASLDDP